MGGLNTHAHLRGLGWLGDGHSLGRFPATNNALKKPLLISHKSDTNGLGARRQRERQADQWWLNAFDAALRDVGTGRETALEVVKVGGERAGLYKRFVRGGILGGTFGEEVGFGALGGERESGEEQTSKRQKKRKRNDEEAPGGYEAGNKAKKSRDTVGLTEPSGNISRSDGKKKRRKAISVAERDHATGDLEVKELREAGQDRVSSDKASQCERGRGNGDPGLEDERVHAKKRRKEERKLKRERREMKRDGRTQTPQRVESDHNQELEPTCSGREVSSSGKKGKRIRRVVLDGGIS